MPDQAMSTESGAIPPALEPEAPLPPGGAEAFDGALVEAAPQAEPSSPASDAATAPVGPAGAAGEPAAGLDEPEVAASTVVVATAGPADGNGAVAAAVSASQGAAAVAASGEAGSDFQLSEEVGLSLATYQPMTALPADRALLRLLVSEKRLVDLWEEIDRLEAQAAALHRGSQKLVIELITRLAAARNMLLHHRDQYENALREVVYVRYRLVRTNQSSLLEQPQAILVYLVVFLALVALGFAFGPQLLVLLGNPAQIAGIASTTLINTLLWGAVGGLSAAYFALQRHVDDFDHQHARWYYLSPIVGAFIGPLMGLLADVSLPALFVLAGADSGQMEVAPALLYLLAWAVGFQHNLLLRLLNTVFKRLMPARPAD